MNRIALCLVLLLAIIGLTLTACSTGGGGGGGGGGGSNGNGVDGPEPGAAGGPCLADGTCNSGLVCNIATNTCEGESGCGSSGETKGGLNDTPRYASIPGASLPRRIKLAEREAGGVDLSPFVPTPCDQLSLNSCVGWAGGYGLMSYLAVKSIDGWVEPTTLDNTGKHFSPSFIFNQVNAAMLGRSSSDTCDEAGTFLSDLFLLLRDTGAVVEAEMPYREFVDRCEVQPDDGLIDEAASFRIEYFLKVEGDVDSVRSYLDQEIPLLVVCSVGAEFGQLRAGDIYDTIESETFSHSMLVVGYDDQAGAIKLMNSWGADWADGGFGLISYDIWESINTEAYIAGNRLAGYGGPGKAIGKDGLAAQTADTVVNPLIDTDGDGYPDVIEIAFSDFALDTPMDPNEPDPEPVELGYADADGDGWPDETEIEFDTDPNDPNDFPFKRGYRFP